jgi:hypothetical protein
MLSRAAALAALEADLALGAEHNYVPPNTDATNVEADIRAHLCEPFTVSAQVMPPGFPFASVGSVLSGMCIAHSPSGNWLVYQPDERRFLCFWGKTDGNLGAHGVYGNSLYCWSA